MLVCATSEGEWNNLCTFSYRLTQNCSFWYALSIQAVSSQVSNFVRDSTTLSRLQKWVCGNNVVSSLWRRKFLTMPRSVYTRAIPSVRNRSGCNTWSTFYSPDEVAHAHLRQWSSYLSLTSNGPCSTQGEVTIPVVAAREASDAFY